MLSNINRGPVDICLALMIWAIQVAKTAQVQDNRSLDRSKSRVVGTVDFLTRVTNQRSIGHN